VFEHGDETEVEYGLYKAALVQNYETLVTKCGPVFPKVEKAMTTSSANGLNTIRLAMLVNELMIDNMVMHQQEKGFVPLSLSEQEQEWVSSVDEELQQLLLHEKMQVLLALQFIFLNADELDKVAPQRAKELQAEKDIN